MINYKTDDIIVHIKSVIELHFFKSPLSKDNVLSNEYREISDSKPDLKNNSVLLRQTI